MALFNKKELEAENARLKELLKLRDVEITRLEANPYSAISFVKLQKENKELLADLCEAKDDYKSVSIQLQNSVSKFVYDEAVKKIELEKSELEKQIELLKNQPIINLQLLKSHNERGAGRKKIATNEMVARVLELSEQGLSHAKIATALTGELGIKIGRTTVGEIVSGKYSAPDEN